MKRALPRLVFPSPSVPPIAPPNADFILSPAVAFFPSHFFDLNAPIPASTATPNIDRFFANLLPAPAALATSSALDAAAFVASSDIPSNSFKPDLPLEKSFPTLLSFKNTSAYSFDAFLSPFDLTSDTNIFASSLVSEPTNFPFDTPDLSPLRRVDPKFLIPGIPLDIILLAI